MPKKQKELEVVGAAQLMENLYSSGLYQEYKKLDYQIGMVKSELKRKLNDHKRTEFSDLGIVAKWQKDYKYEIQEEELKEYLNDLGILAHCVTIDFSRIDDEEKVGFIKEKFRNPKKYYVRITPNKLGRVEKEEIDFSPLQPKQLVVVWQRNKRELDELELHIEIEKRKMYTCSILEKERKLKSNFGSVSLIEKKLTLNMDALYHHMGEGFLLSYGKPNMAKIEEYVQKGFITPKELDEFRVVRDIQSKFIVTTLEKEGIMFSVLQQKNRKIANSLQELWSLNK